ncbi:MAG TPA: pyridoxamine 5'-phosphate oxidase family protein [Myxococcales bacterium]
MEYARALRALLASERQGMLSTLSVRHQGAPFGSMAPYALWESGEPLFYLSSLAVHTQNVLADPRASLLVSDSSSPALQPPRATLVGRCVKLAEAEAAREAFATRHPGSEALRLPGFSPFLLHVQEIRWIGGFAAAAWLPPRELREPD